MKFLLEYSDTQFQFHYNYINHFNELNQKLNTNNYKPITIIPEELHENQEFIDLMDSLRKTEASFETAQSTVLWWLLNNEEKW